MMQRLEQMLSWLDTQQATRATANRVDGAAAAEMETEVAAQSVGVLASEGRSHHNVSGIVSQQC